MNRMWQIGVVVADLNEAMAWCSAAFGLNWAEAERIIDVVHEGEPKTITLRFAISEGGPVHVEWLEGELS